MGTSPSSIEAAETVKAIDTPPAAASGPEDAREAIAQGLASYGQVRFLTATRCPYRERDEREKGLKGAIAQGLASYGQVRFLTATRCPYRERDEREKGLKEALARADVEARQVRF
jgi:hypothetical protein